MLPRAAPSCSRGAPMPPTSASYAAGLAAESRTPERRLVRYPRNSAPAPAQDSLHRSMRHGKPSPRITTSSASPLVTAGEAARPASPGRAGNRAATPRSGTWARSGAGGADKPDVRELEDQLAEARAAVSRCAAAPHPPSEPPQASLARGH